jgi:hypothetical protein
MPTWSRPPRIAKSINAARHHTLPEQLQVRLLSVEIAVKAHRTRKLWLVSTLMDAREWNASEIAKLYLKRWQVELFFASIYPPGVHIKREIVPPPYFHRSNWPNQFTFLIHSPGNFFTSQK